MGLEIFLFYHAKEVAIIISFVPLKPFSLKLVIKSFGVFVSTGMNDTIASLFSQ